MADMKVAMVWVRMNGSVGCMPDSSEEYDSKEEAIEGALDLFEDLPENITEQMRRMLTEDGIYYFDVPEAGADYVSVAQEPVDDEVVNAELQAAQAEYDATIAAARKAYNEQVAEFEQQFHHTYEAAITTLRAANHATLRKFGLED